MNEEANAERLKQIAEQSPYPRLDIPEGESPDLLEYLVNQPEVEMEYVPLPEEEKAEPEELTEEQQKVLALADYIRMRAKAAQITPYAMLLSQDEKINEVFELLQADENHKDIIQIKGAKDSYYYSNLTMTEYFANIAVLVEEKDEPRTIAHIVRDRSRLKSSTPVSHFMDYPYSYSKETVDKAREIFESHPDYRDIKVFQLRNKAEYFHSTRWMPGDLAIGLAEESQDELSDIWDPPSKKVNPSLYR